MERMIAILLIAALASACAAGPARVETNATLERYEAYAGAPVRDFTSFDLDWWEPLTRTRLVLWNGVNEAYLVTVWDTCTDLKFADAIRVTKTGNTISTFEKVYVGRDRCPIQEIRPIDVRRMKAERKEMKAPAGRD